MKGIRMIRMKGQDNKGQDEGGRNIRGRIKGVGW